MTAALTYGSAAPFFTAGAMFPMRAASLADLVNRTLGTVLNLNATGTRVAYIGQVIWADRGNHAVSSSGGCEIATVLGATTFAAAAGGTTIDVGIQNLDASTPNLPDGTFTVKKTLVSATDTLTGSAINAITMAAGAGETINNAAWRAIVWDMTLRGGADTVIPQAYGQGGGGGQTTPYCMKFSAAAWSSGQAWPNIWLKADDGTYGWLSTPFLPNSQTDTSYNSGSSPKEYGGEIKLPWPITLEAIEMPVKPSGASADWELCIYSTPTGTATLVATATTVSAKHGGTNADVDSFVLLDSPIALSAGTVYAITARPTSANSITIRNHNFGTSGNRYMASLPMGVNSIFVSRAGTGTSAFTEDNTKFVPMVLHISKFDNGAGGSGGMLYVPDMAGT